MKNIIILVVLLFLALSVKMALADCEWNGRLYPVGTNINGLVCQPDGTWR